MDTTSLPAGTVTFLFTDIEGSTRLLQHLGERYAAVLADHHRLLREALQAWGGNELGTEGDAFCVVFSQAADALAAALAAQRALATHSWPEGALLRVRMGLHTGAPTLTPEGYVGLDLHRAARLRDAAHGNQILLSERTRSLVAADLPAGVSLRDLGAHRLKDLQQPEHLFQLLAPDLPADFPQLRSLEAFRHNLPVQLTSFIGREQAMAEVTRLLAVTRLLTLIGSGGCGKTRLALQVAADRLEEYADGVWLVELAALADPDLVPQAVASALGVREEAGRPLTATLIDYLRPRSLLLVLDNCEHLLSACAQLADLLLRSCPDLRVLATSREGLGIAGETTYRVPSLSLPDLKSLPAAEGVAAFEAPRLFLERAMAAVPSFAVHADNASAVAQVCQRLDGIPLAIELAAARVKALPVEQIAARLDDRFRLLTGGSRTALPRQQTLRALIDWSYELLAEQERVLLRRLSVFAGGWRLEAAEAVCAVEGLESWEVLDLLIQLVEKSLVVYEERQGEARYRLLETVRLYCRERLMEAKETEATRGRHRDWYLTLVEEAEPRIRGTHEGVWLDRLERELDNLRAVLDGSREQGEAELELRLAGALWSFWGARGYWQEGGRFLEEALARAPRSAATGDAVLMKARARALLGVGRLAFWRGERVAARPRLEESVRLCRELADTDLLAWSLSSLFSDTGELSVGEESAALFREVGDRVGLALTLYGLGCAAVERGDYRSARTHYDEGLAVARELGDRGVLARPLSGLAALARSEGDDAAARRYLEESVALRRETRDPFLVTFILLLGDVACEQSDYEEAKAFFEEAQALSRERGNTEGIAAALAGQARVAWARGDHQTARALLEEAHTVGQGAHACMSQGHVLLELGDYTAARSRYAEGLALRRAEENSWLIVGSLLEVGHAAWLEGEYAVTQSCAVEALEILQRRMDRGGVDAALESMAVAALAQGKREHAARLQGAAEAQREAVGLAGPFWWRRPRERIGAAVREASLQQECAAAWAEGRAMLLEDAIRYALQEPGADVAAP